MFSFHARSYVSLFCIGMDHGPRRRVRVLLSMPLPARVPHECGPHGAWMYQEGDRLVVRLPGYASLRFSAAQAPAPRASCGYDSRPVYSEVRGFHAGVWRRLCFLVLARTSPCSSTSRSPSPPSAPSTRADTVSSFTAHRITVYAVSGSSSPSPRGGALQLVPLLISSYA